MFVNIQINFNFTPHSFCEESNVYSENIPINYLCVDINTYMVNSGNNNVYSINIEYVSETVVYKLIYS